MSKYEVTGKLDTVVAVVYKDQHLESGKWETAPGGTHPTGTSTIFKATNRQDAVTMPPEGWCRFVAADGTIFTFHFDCPVSRENYCYSSIDNLSGPWFVPTPEYPKGGADWTVTFKIDQAVVGEFLDAPIFPADLIASPKCNLYTESKIKELIGDRTCLYLKDVFASNILLPVAKVWCATHPIFLTPSSKAQLLRDLAQVAERELSKDMYSFSSVLDQMTEINDRSSKSGVLQGDIRDLKQVIDDKYSIAKKENNKRDCELIDTTASLLNPDFGDGWANAVSSYIGSAQGDMLAERLTSIINLVEKRL